MNTKVIIITTESKFKDVNDSAKFDGFDKLKEKGFLIFEDGKLVPADNLDNAEIVFVWDRNEGGEVENLDWWDTSFLSMKKSDGEKWYVIRHTKGIQPQVTDSIFPIEGRHTVGNPIYSKVCEILLADDGDRKERIIKEVVFKIKIEAISEFLEICNTKRSPDCDDFNKLNNAGIDVESLPKLEGSFESDKYIQSLSKLTDELMIISKTE